MKRTIVIILIALIVLGVIGCAAWTNKQKGVVVGAATGGVIGGLIGKVEGNTALGAIIGATVGGLAGVWIGSYMDKQAADLESELGETATIERVGEGIKVTLDSGLLFDFNKADIQEKSKESLAKFAKIVNNYKDTNIILEGHTDNVGDQEYNLRLSLRRAQAVGDFIKDLKVDVARITEFGYGEIQPITDNGDEAGRSQNRRVEIAIFANEELKKQAVDATK
ncbi:MAG: OmpA family protein [Bacteroidales bacterium]|nr:OmpA family protein [Bacteroidales bacterium]